MKNQGIQGDSESSQTLKPPNRLPPTSRVKPVKISNLRRVGPIPETGGADGKFHAGYFRASKLGAAANNSYGHSRDKVRTIDEYSGLESDKRPLLKAKLNAILNQVLQKTSNRILQQENINNPISIRLVESAEPLTQINLNTNQITISIADLRNILNYSEAENKNWDLVAHHLCHELSHIVYDQDPNFTMFQKYTDSYSTKHREVFCDLFALNLMDEAGFNVKFAPSGFISETSNSSSTGAYPSNSQRERRLIQCIENNYWTHYSETSSRMFQAAEISEIKIPILSEVLNDPIQRNSAQLEGSVEACITDLFHLDTAEALMQRIKGTNLSPSSQELLAASITRSQRQNFAKPISGSIMALRGPSFIVELEDFLAAMPNFSIFQKYNRKDANEGPTLAKTKNYVHKILQREATKGKLKIGSSVDDSIPVILAPLQEAAIELNKNFSSTKNCRNGQCGVNLGPSFNENSIKTAFQQMESVLLWQIKNKLGFKIISNQAQIQQIQDLILNSITLVFDKYPQLKALDNYPLLRMNFEHEQLAEDICSRVKNLIENSRPDAQTEYNSLVRIPESFDLKIGKGILNLGLEFQEIDAKLITALESLVYNDERSILFSFLRNTSNDNKFEIFNRSIYIKDYVFKHMNIFQTNTMPPFLGHAGVSISDLEMAEKMGPALGLGTAIQQALKADIMDLPAWFLAINRALYKLDSDKASPLANSTQDSVNLFRNSLVALKTKVSKHPYSEQLMASLASGLAYTYKIENKSLDFDSTKAIFAVYPDIIPVKSLALLFNSNFSKESSLFKHNEWFVDPLRHLSLDQIRELLLMSGTKETAAKEVLVKQLIRRHQLPFISNGYSCLEIREDANLYGNLAKTGDRKGPEQLSNAARLLEKFGSELGINSLEKLADQPLFTTGKARIKINPQQLIENLSDADIRLLISHGRAIDRIFYLKNYIKHLVNQNRFDENALRDLSTLTSKDDQFPYQYPKGYLPQFSESITNNPTNRNTCISARDFLFLNYFKEHGMQFLKDMPLDQLLSWFEKNMNYQSSYKDTLISQLLKDKFETIADLNLQLKFLSLYSDHKKSLNFSMQAYGQHKDSFKTLTNRAQFLTEIFPEPSTIRDTLLDDIFSSFHFTIQDFELQQNHFTINNQTFQRDGDIFNYGVFSKFLNVSPENKGALLLWLTGIDSNKSARVKFLEKGLGFQVDEFKALLKITTIRHWFIEQLLIGDKGLFWEKDKSTLTSLLDRICSHCYNIEANDTQPSRDLKNFAAIVLRNFSNKFRPEKVVTVLNGLVDTYLSDNLHDANDLVVAFLNSSGTLGIKLGQIFGSNKTVIEEYPKLASKVSSLKENALSPPWTETISAIKRNAKLKPHKIRIRRRMNTASIKTVLDVKLDGQRKVIATKKAGAGKFLAQEAQDLNALITSLMPSLKAIWGLSALKDYGSRIQAMVSEDLDFAQELTSSQTLLQSCSSEDASFIFSTPEIDANKSDDSTLVADYVEGKSLENWLLTADKKIAQQVIAAIHKNFAQQIHKGFFHADPHSANIRIEKLGSKQYKISWIDTGLCSSVSSKVQDLISSASFKSLAQEPNQTGMLSRILKQPWQSAQKLIFIKRLVDVLSEGQNLTKRSKLAIGKALVEASKADQSSRIHLLLSSLEQVPGFNLPHGANKVINAFMKLPQAESFNPSYLLAS